MGSVGDCYDNAICESFFATLECELLDRTTFRNHEQARAALFDFIEGWYNTHCRHSSIDYNSPAQFEREHGRGRLTQTLPVHETGVGPGTKWGHATPSRRAVNSYTSCRRCWAKRSDAERVEVAAIASRILLKSHLLQQNSNGMLNPDMNKITKL
jgi:hypothetical protein